MISDREQMLEEKVKTLMKSIELQRDIQQIMQDRLDGKDEDIALLKATIKRLQDNKHEIS